MLGFIQQLSTSLETFDLYTVELVPGPNWEAGKSAQEQQDFEAHFQYWMQQLQLGNLFVTTGFLKWDGAFGIYSPQVATYEQATAITNGDPWHELGILTALIQECSVLPDCSTLPETSGTSTESASAEGNSSC